MKTKTDTNTYMFLCCAIVYVYVRGALSRATLLFKMRALEIGHAKRKSNDGKIKKTDRQYVTNETSRYKSHFVYNSEIKLV